MGRKCGGYWFHFLCSTSCGIVNFLPSLTSGYLWQWEVNMKNRIENILLGIAMLVIGYYFMNPYPDSYVERFLGIFALVVGSVIVFIRKPD